ncbi:MAG: hypothetical protein LBK53_05680 [Heliobacteriaceae bacterium]|jgi:hypothetical protein|nr:hypothetical protein [Heliobacteriaceae bacterium]
MKVNFSFNNYVYKPYSGRQRQYSPQYDTVSFGAMKKNQFDGFNLLCINMYKFPLEKFKTADDLQSFAQEELDKKLDLEQYKTKNSEDTQERLGILAEWKRYLTEENELYANNPALTLIVAGSIVKELKPNNREMPPALNPGVLADTVEQIKNILKDNRECMVDFNKIYRNNLRLYAMGSDETDTGETETRWVVIPSQEHDSENFEDNVERLKALSHRSWCTKSFNARPYLSEGDFHIYLENGKPKVGIRFKADTIREIQGERNNSRIPHQYTEQIEDHINNKYEIPREIKSGIEDAKRIKQKVDNYRLKLANAISQKDFDSILKESGIEVSYDENNKRILSEYRPLDYDFSYADLGINEKELLKGVIEGNADFSNSQVTNLSALQSIGGDAYFNNSQVRDLSALQSIGGDADFRNSQVTDLSALQSIGRHAGFQYSQVTDLSALQSIGGDVGFQNSQEIDLSALQSVGGDADFNNSQVRDLRSLQSVGGNAAFYNSQVRDLRSLQSVGRYAGFRNSQVTDLSNLQSVGESILLSKNQKIKLPAWITEDKIRYE